eukprot:jgi/Tetstr1/463913/TSEL_000811.t1
MADLAPPGKRASRRQGNEAHGGVVDGTASRVVKTLTAAVLPPDAPLPRPPLTEKELCWMNAADKKQSDADKKRKRPVKKRPGKKLTVAESEAEAEAEAARSRQVPRARKNKNKQ